MKTKIAAGLLAGLSAAAIAAPTFAQTGTASSSASSGEIDRGMFERRAPMTQDQLKEQIAREQAMLSNIDAFVAIQKDAMQDHIAALNAAAAIEDDDEREDAVRAAHEAMRTQVETAIEADPDLKDLKMGGPMMGFGPGGGHHGRGGPGGPMGGMLEEKLGMTKDEIKAALESGKTIEQLAEEKGIELPARPDFKGFRGMMDAQSSSAQ